MRTPDAAIEVRGNLRPGQRMLEHADVMLGRADQDGDFVEPDVVRGFFQDAPSDLDALAPLTWRGKPDELAAPLAFGRRLGGKEVTRKPREIGIAVRLESPQLNA